MNTRAEIQEAFEDFNAGRLGVVPANAIQPHRSQPATRKQKLGPRGRVSLGFQLLTGTTGGEVRRLTDSAQTTLVEWSSCK
jgi:hypothetical protein